jgi:CubicO group peptidase (beta-lactamase class C family)
MKRFHCVLLAVLAPGCLPESAQADEATDTAIAAEVNKLFEKWDRPDSPGCALGIIRDGKVVFARGYGMADLDHGVPITTKSVFEVGSMTKSITCACLAILMDQGKLDPEDDLHKYVLEMPHYNPPITIRHLIRCECGLRPT